MYTSNWDACLLGIIAAMSTKQSAEKNVTATEKVQI